MESRFWVWRGRVNRFKEFGSILTKNRGGPWYTFILAKPKTWRGPGPPGPLGDAIPDFQKKLFTQFNILKKKSFSERFDWFLGPKIDFENWNFPIFVSSDLTCLRRYQKILRVVLLGCKNLINYTWLSMKFYDSRQALMPMCSSLP